MASNLWTWTRNRNTQPVITAKGQETCLNTMTIINAAPTAEAKDGLKNDDCLPHLPTDVRHPHADRSLIHRHTQPQPRNHHQRPQRPSRRLPVRSPMTPEYIVWLDHQEPYGDNVWWSPDQHAEITGPARVYTVGYIVKETDDWIAVVGQITEDGWTSQPLVLVKSCILTRTKIKQGTLPRDIS